MLRSAAIASSKAVLRLVAASSRPSILYRPFINADAAVRPNLLLPIHSVPRSPVDFSRSYARGRNLEHEEEYDDDEDADDSEDEDFDDMDGEDFDDVIDEFGESEEDGETSD